jgi:MFS family permease
LSDRLGAVKVMVFCSALMFAASLVLFGLTASNALLFLLPFALGYGGTFVLIQRLTADLFGRNEAGKILGTITMIEVIGAAIGGRVTGYLADQSGGDYRTAFYGVTVTAAAAFLATIVIYILNGKRPAEHTTGL